MPGTHLGGQHLALQEIDRLGHDPAGTPLFIAHALPGAQHLGLLEQQVGRWAQGGFVGLDSTGQAGQQYSEKTHGKYPDQ